MVVDRLNPKLLTASLAKSRKAMIDAGFAIKISATEVDDVRNCDPL